MQRLAFREVTIDGFRGIKQLELEKLGPLNLLVGENNSGKTSVLEALSVLCNRYEPYEWLSMIRRRDFGGLDETRVQSLRWCFNQSGDLVDPDFMFEGCCNFSCKGEYAVTNLRAEYRDIVGEPGARELERIARYRNRTGEFADLEAQWRGAELTHHIVNDGSFREIELSDPPAGPITVQFWEEDRMLGRAGRSRRRWNIPTETLTPYSYQLNRLQVSSHSNQLLLPFIDEIVNSKQAVLDLIQEFDPDISDIVIASLRGGRPAIYLKHKRLGPAPLSVFGDALRRAVLLASTIQSLKGGVLLIDEIETGIHVTALKRVFAWLASTAQRYQVQIFATTHSLEAVDAVSDSVEDRIDDLATFHINQSTERTTVKRIAGEMLLRLRRERGLDVR